MVKGEEEVPKLAAPLLLSSVEEVALSKMQDIIKLLREEKSIEKLQPLAQSLSTLLDVYDKAKKLSERKS